MQFLSIFYPSHALATVGQAAAVPTWVEQRDPRHGRYGNWREKADVE